MVDSSKRFLDKINTKGSYCDKTMLVETTSDSHIVMFVEDENFMEIFL